MEEIYEVINQKLSLIGNSREPSSRPMDNRSGVSFQREKSPLHYTPPGFHAQINHHVSRPNLARGAQGLSEFTLSKFTKLARLRLSEIYQSLLDGSGRRNNSSIVMILLTKIRWLLLPFILMDMHSCGIRFDIMTKGN